MDDRFSPYATPSATRTVLERHGLATKYALGQNFLVNDAIIGKIIELADVQSTDCVLEVGPGIGTLTYALASRARHVIAIEKDTDLPTVLADTLADVAERFSLLSMDALDVVEHPECLAVANTAFNEEGYARSNEPDGHSGDSERSVLLMPNKLVANLPYAVAATIVLDYLQHFDFLESATVMVQKEVADRMTARVGTKSYGAYTVKLSLFAQPAGRFAVSPGNFYPPPHVESTVLRLNRVIAHNPLTQKPLTNQQLQAVCTMADAAFTNRRKTLMNSCRAYFANKPQIQERLPQIFEAAGIDPKRRGETLTRDEFITLGLQL